MPGEAQLLQLADYLPAPDQNCHATRKTPFHKEDSSRNKPNYISCSFVYADFVENEELAQSHVQIAWQGSKFAGSGTVWSGAKARDRGREKKRDRARERVRHREGGKERKQETKNEKEQEREREDTTEKDKRKRRQQIKRTINKEKDEREGDRARKKRKINEKQ